MNLAPDTLPVEIAFPAALLLVVAYFWLEAWHSRKQRRHESEYLARAYDELRDEPRG